MPGRNRKASRRLRAGVFHDRLLALRRVDGRRMGLESTLILANKLRNVVVRHCPEPVPHLAFLPIPFVGSEHADGHLLGFALAIPKSADQSEQRRCLSPVLGFDEDGSPRRVHLYHGANFEWLLEMEDRASPPIALRSEVWTRPAPALGNGDSHRI